MGTRVRGVLLQTTRKADLKGIGEIKMAIGEIRIRDIMKGGTIADLVILAKVATEATSTPGAAKEVTSMEVAGDHRFPRFYFASTTMAQSTNERMNAILNRGLVVESIGDIALTSMIFQLDPACFCRD